MAGEVEGGRAQVQQAEAHSKDDLGSLQEMYRVWARLRNVNRGFLLSSLFRTGRLECRKGREGEMKKKMGSRVLQGLLIGGMLTVPFARLAHGQTPAPEPLKLRVGDVAPDFKLQYFDGHDLKDVHLSDYHGKKNVVLAFYIFAFTGG